MIVDVEDSFLTYACIFPSVAAFARKKRRCSYADNTGDLISAGPVIRAIENRLSLTRTPRPRAESIKISVAEEHPAAMHHGDGSSSYTKARPICFIILVIANIMFI